MDQPRARTLRGQVAWTKGKAFGPGSFLPKGTTQYGVEVWYSPNAAEAASGATGRQRLYIIVGAGLDRNAVQDIVQQERDRKITERDWRESPNAQEAVEDLGEDIASELLAEEELDDFARRFEESGEAGSEPPDESEPTTSETAEEESPQFTVESITELPSYLEPQPLPGADVVEQQSLLSKSIGVAKSALQFGVGVAKSIGKFFGFGR